MTKRALLLLISQLFSALAFSQSSDITVEVGDKHISISKNEETLVYIDSLSFNYITPDTQQIIYESKDSTVVKLIFNHMPEHNQVNAFSDHEETLVITNKSGALNVYCAPKWASYMTVHMKDLNDHYYGLVEMLYPDNLRSPDLRGQVVDVEVFGEGQRYYENYSSVWSAFYFSSNGYASFMDTYAKGKYYLAINGRTKIEHETGKLDWHIFTGDYNDIYSQYYKLIGKPKFIPLWACGPIVWRDQNDGGKDEILDDVKKFTNLKIPLTGIMVDRPYSNGTHGWSKMDFSDKFSNPEIWIKKLKNEYGLEFITWVASVTFGDQDFPGLLPGYFSYLDLTHPAAKAKWYNRLKTEQYKYGVKAHKIDRADEHFPVSEPWYDHTRESERRNKYAYLFSQVTDSMLRASWGDDQFTFARAAFHRSQPYLSALWGGDVRASWEGMAANMANAIRASFMGFPNWGTDVGGYLGEKGTLPEDLYIRWLQWGAFNGLFEIKYDGPGGAGEDRAPWKYGENVQLAFKEACRLRMEWLPYIYSQLNTADKHGPMMKPLAMIFPEDKKTFDIWDEYMFGESLLIAPVFSSSGKRSVYIPDGFWLDYYSGEKFRGPVSIDIETPISQLPIYIKGNSIFAKGNIYAGSQKTWTESEKEHIDIYYYPTHVDFDKENSIFEFMDANNNNKVIPVTAQINNDDITMDIPAISYPGNVIVLTEEKPKGVRINGKKVKFYYRKNLVEFVRPANVNCKIEIY